MKKQTKKVQVIVKKTEEKYNATNPVLGIGAQARECILKGFTFAQTYDLIKARVPNTQFSKKCYYWYRNDLNKRGHKVPALPKKEVVKAESK